MARTAKGGSSKTTSDEPERAAASAALASRLVSQSGTGGGNPAAAGSHLMPIDTIRREMTYVLFESHFDAIAGFNTSAFVCFSLAGVLFSVFISMATGWMFASGLSEPVVLTTKVIAWVSGLSTLALVSGGIALTLQKKSQVDRIKKKTEAKNAIIKE